MLNRTVQSYGDTGVSAIDSAGHEFVDLIADLKVTVNEGDPDFAIQVLRKGMLRLAGGSRKQIADRFGTQPPSIDARWDNLVAAWVEEISARRSSEVPAWTRSVQGLSTRWIVSGRTHGRLFEREVTETPAPFKGRNIVLRGNEIAA